MLAAGITQLGGAVSDLELPDPPPPASGEAVIEVRAAGVANWDDIVRTGGWDAGTVPPMALGVEAAGVITAVGPDAGGWAAGDEVMTHPLPLRHQGAWSERLLAPTHLLARKPDALSWEQAGVLPVPVLTADQALDAVIRGAGNAWLLVNGAGGVTGRMVAALAVLRGARVIAVAGPASADALTALGVEHVVDRHDPDWPSDVAGLTGGTGVTAAVNAARGGEGAALAAVADGGALATITGSPPPVERGVTVTDIYVRPEGERLGELAQMLESSDIELVVGTTLPLARAAEALELATQGRGGGAIVLTPAR